MIQLDRLEISLKASACDDPNSLHTFGRNLDFTSGLNLVVGDNTSGKTTLVESLFYALGMEELIEGKPGTRSLDKAVREQFLCGKINGHERAWQVKQSYVRLQLSNSNHDAITIMRYIQSVDLKRPDVLYVWRTPMINITRDLDKKEYYVHNQGDHNEDYNVGFYAFLADFAGLPIIKVPARNKDYTLLYMQTLFSATYIEQKRGWSDFFANIRSFNIMSPKQRLVEYIMDYRTNEKLINKIKLSELKKNLEKSWENKVIALQNYLACNGLYMEGLESDLGKMKTALEDLHIVYRLKNAELGIYLEDLQERISSLEKKQNSELTNCKNEQYLEALNIYEGHKDEYDRFCIKLSNEDDNLSTITKQVRYIDAEINRYRSLRRVNNVITTLDVKICPICHQKMPLERNHDINVLSSDDIDESINVLVVQKSFLSPLIKNLEELVSNMKLNKQYLDRQLRKEKVEIEMLASLHDIALNPLSTREQFQLVEAKSQLASFAVIKDYIKNRIKDLECVKQSYCEVCNELKEKKNKEHEEQPIAKQLSAFKDLLRKFGYTSNSVANSVYFKEDKTTYQYLPVITHNDGGEEEIRSDSSASDFIRSIWAYYLTLLKFGNHHPGFLVMDEPCQHSMKEDSLLHLFEVCSQIKDRQVILFCSSQPKTEESKDKNNNIEENVIETLAKSIESKGLMLNYLSIDPKAVVEENS